MGSVSPPQEEFCLLILLPLVQGMRAESWEHSLGSAPHHQEGILLLGGDLGMGAVPRFVCGLPTIHSLWCGAQSVRFRLCLPLYFGDFSTENNEEHINHHAEWIKTEKGSAPLLGMGVPVS